MEIMKIDMNEFNLVVEKYDGKEFIIYFQDKDNGCITQDLVAISQSFNRNGEPVLNTIDCLVWADEDDENYTNKFSIKRFSDLPK